MLEFFASLESDLPVPSHETTHLCQWHSGTRLVIGTGAWLCEVTTSLVGANRTLALIQQFAQTPNVSGIGFALGKRQVINGNCEKIQESHWDRFVVDRVWTGAHYGKGRSFWPYES
jgi:hypothetical protein